MLQFCHRKAKLYSVGQKKSARLRELATVLGASSRNLADVLLHNPVQRPQGLGRGAGAVQLRRGHAH